MKSKTWILIVLLCFAIAGCDDDSGAYSKTPGGVSYDAPPESSPPTIPAPGAILLASGGVVAVGWLRRRKWL